MTRKKNYKRKVVNKHNMHNSGDKTSLITELNDLKVLDMNQNTPMKLPAEIVQAERTPESIFFGSNRGVLGSDSYSPKFIPRVSKLKLNLDIPENDSDSEDSDCKSVSAIDSKVKETEMKQLIEMPNALESGTEDAKLEGKQLFPLKVSGPVEDNICEFTALNIESTPKRFKDTSKVPLESSTERVIGNSESSIISGGRLENRNELQILPSLPQLKLLKLCTAPKSVPPKLLNGKDFRSLRNFDKTQSLVCCNNISFTPDANKPDNFSGSILPPTKRCRLALYEVKNESLDPISPKENRLELSMKSVAPLDISNCHSKTLETYIETSQHHISTLSIHCTVSKTSIFLSKRLKIPFLKVAAFCSWLTRKIFNYIKRVCMNFRQNLASLFSSQTDLTPLITENLNHILSTIRCENERILTVLSEKVSHISEELTQIKASSEASLIALTTEINYIRDANKQLTENSTKLFNELRSLHETLEKVESDPKKISQSALLPPPPPPPPPPPLMQKMKTPTTPKSSRGLRKTPRKCSTQNSSRPCITVEDLLKVTLKKAPQNSKENRRHTIPGPRGPVVSLDMLRSVKLRSARRRACDQNTRSPRSRSALMINRVNSSLRISPISTGSESSLNRILKKLDINSIESKSTSKNRTQNE